MTIEYRPPLSWLQLVAIGVFCIYTHFAHAQTDQNEKIQYEFAQNRTTYSVRASFTSPLAMSEILNILFDYHHVQEFTKSVDSARLVDEGENWNRITFRQCALFGCVDATYFREVEKESKKLTFVQEETHLSGNFFIPRVITNAGYYQITTHKDGSLVEFYQAVELEKSMLITVQQRYARSNTIEFIEDLYEYLQESRK